MQSKELNYSKVFIVFSISFLLTAIAGCFLLFPKSTQALGISPPWVINHDLMKGSHFEKKVYINQGAPKEALLAHAEISIPEKMEGWITLLPGTDFRIPVAKLFPVTVVVDVPEDAEVGKYYGEIRITTQSEELAEGQVSIGVGLAIALDLEVSQEEIIDFTILSGGVLPMEEGWPIKLSLTIDNKGNTEIRPQKVSIDIYGRPNRRLYGSAEDTGLAYVGSFQRGDIIAEFPFHLPVGLYLIKTKVYKSEEEIMDFDFSFEVLEKGTLPSETPWLKWVLIGSAALIGAVIWLWGKYGKMLSEIFKVASFRSFINTKIKKKKTVKKKKVKSLSKTKKKLKKKKR